MSQSASPTRTFVPFALAGAFFAVLLCLLVRHGLHVNNGTFVYPLDDAYIHIAASRNVALHGVWGISPTVFSGASSSPLWTLLLALVTKIAGVHVATPLVLNALAGLGILYLASWLLGRLLPRAHVAVITLWLLVLVLVMPLPGVALIGMEHVLHALLALGLLGLTAMLASRERALPIATRELVGCALLGFACGAARYESCFLVFAVGVVLLWRRRVAAALLVMGCAAIGPAAYGLYSRAHSGIALPFSVVMKAAGRSTSHNPWSALRGLPMMPVLAVVGLALVLRIVLSQTRDYRGDRFWTAGMAFGWMAFLTIALHLVLGPYGWLMRYEAYLYAIGIVALALLLGEVHAMWGEAGRSRSVIYVAVLFALVSLVMLRRAVDRAHGGWSDVAVSMHDRYVEHLPQALFVDAAYPHATVLANDIGFLAFYAPDVTILDPLGLGSLEPVKLVRAHVSPTSQFVGAWANREGAQLAIIHTDFPGTEWMTPAGWVPVESWCFPHNLVFQNHIESFYAPNEAAAAELRARLAAFSATAPELVRYRFPQDGTVPPVPVRGISSFCPAPQNGSSK